MDRAFSFQGKSKRVVTDIPHSDDTFVMHPAIPEVGGLDSLLYGGIIPFFRHLPYESAQSRTGRNRPFQVRKFEVAMGIDHAGNQDAAEKLDTLERIHPGYIVFDRQEPPCSIKGQYGARYRA